MYIGYYCSDNFNNKMKNSDLTTERKREFSFRNSEHIDQATKAKQYRSYLGNDQRDQNIEPNDQFGQYVSTSLEKDRSRLFESPMIRFSRRTESYKEIQPRNRFVTGEQFQFLTQEHLVEVEKLLLEISRLHDLCYDLEKAKVIEVQKVKDQFQHQLYSHLSAIKENHSKKIDLLEAQVKKYRELLQRKTQECHEITKNIDRENQHLNLENDRLKNEIKSLIRRKTDEVYEVQSGKEKEIEKLTKQSEDRINEMREFYNEEMEKVKKMLNQKSRQFERLRDEKNNNDKEQERMIEQWNQEKYELENRLSESVDRSNERHKRQKERLQEILNHELQMTEKTAQMQNDLLKQEIQRLMELMTLKDQEILKITALADSQSLAHQFQISRHLNQNKELTQKIRQNQIQSLKQTELLKVRMASLHQADIKQLVSLYETKLQGLSLQKQRADEECNRVQAHRQQQMHAKYEMKKKYEIAISKLNGKLLSIKTGMIQMQSEFKQKIDNERSLMLLTSKSFIKEAELKDNNVKFYEQQLKKLRQLLDMQSKELQNSEKNVQEKIKQAEEQLRLLSSKIVRIKTENEEKEIQLKRTIQQKDREIETINSLFIKKQEMDKDEQRIKVEEQVMALKQELDVKSSELGNLHYKCEDLEKLNSYLKTELEQLKMDTEIMQTQSKERYTKIAQEMVKELKDLYERRLRELETDKIDLQKINTNQTEKMTNLILKYNELQTALNKVTTQNTKLTKLQNRIISLGTGNNLVKNMAQLFKN